MTSRSKLTSINCQTLIPEILNMIVCFGYRRLWEADSRTAKQTRFLVCLAGNNRIQNAETDCKILTV